MLLGDEMYDNEGNSNRLKLKVIDSKGYGVVRDDDDIGLVTNEGWLYNPEERDKFTVSCTKITHDYDDSISNSSGNDDDSLTKYRKKISLAWHGISSHMQETAIEEPYRVMSNNCCTVSYESIRHVRDDKREQGSILDENAIKKINKRDFNFLGMGISFDASDDGFLHYIAGLFRSSSDSVSGGLVYIKRKVFSDGDKDKKEL